MDRLARNLDDLRRTVNDLTNRGITVEFVKESLSFTGDDTAMSTLLLSVMGAFAEFERSLIRERQAEGIAIAKEDGRYKGSQQALTEQQQKEVREKIYAGESKTAVAKKYGVSRNTIYKCLDTV